MGLKNRWAGTFPLQKVVQPDQPLSAQRPVVALSERTAMSLPHAHVDPQGLQEFSVVFTDRSLNHMSARFQGAMREVSALLKEVYNGGTATALIPGGGPSLICCTLTPKSHAFATEHTQ